MWSQRKNPSQPAASASAARVASRAGSASSSKGATKIPRRDDMRRNLPEARRLDPRRAALRRKGAGRAWLCGGRSGSAELLRQEIAQGVAAGGLGLGAEDRVPGAGDRDEPRVAHRAG